MKDVKGMTDRLLFGHLMFNESLDIVDKGNIRDYFHFKALDAMEGGLAEATSALSSFETLSEYCERTALVAPELKIKSLYSFYAGFFFALSQLISLKKQMPLLPGELLDRGSWEKSFEVTLEKLEAGEE